MKTGKFEVDKSLVESKIYEALTTNFKVENIPNEKWGSDTYWTLKVKGTVGIVGQNNGFLIASSGFKENGYLGEWLFDMVWYENHTDKKQYDDTTECVLKNVLLVMESEWNETMYEIQFDFEKLMVARTDHRLMVFQAENVKVIENHIKYLNSIVTKSHFEPSTKGDRYMYAVWNKDKKEFYFDLFIHLPQ